MKKIAIAILVGAMLVLATGVPALAWVAARDSGTIDVTGNQIYNPATGGYITLNGTVDWRYQLVVSDEDGSLHWTMHVNGKATGIDDESLETYQIKLNRSGILNVFDFGAERTFVWCFRAEAPGALNNLYAKILIHWVVPQGLYFDKITFEIR